MNCRKFVGRARSEPIHAKSSVRKSRLAAFLLGIAAIASGGLTQRALANSDFTSVLAGQLSDGRVQLFTARGNLVSDLFSEWKVDTSSSAGWTGWTPFLNPGLYGSLSGDLGAVGQWPNGQLQIFVPERTFGGVVTSWKSSTDSNSSWTNYQYLTMEQDAVVSVAAGPLEDGRLQIFMSTGNAGPRPNILLTMWIGAPQETWPAAVPFVPQPPQWLTHLTVGQLSDGRLQLWGANGTNIWTTWKETTDPNSAWTGWSSFQSLPFTVESLAVGKLPDGRLQIFAATSDHRVHTAWKETTDPNAAWSGWTVLASFLKTGQDITIHSLAVAPLSDGRLQLWMLDGNGNFSSTWKVTTDPNSSWTSVSPFPAPF